MKTIALITFIIGIALFSTRAQEKPSAIPSETRISGAIITTIDDGDFVHPTFSPDGKVLAYSSVLVNGDLENTEVLLHNLGTNRRSLLLSSKKAATYATYKAFVTEMKWTSAKRLAVKISDGDVDSTQLIFDPQRRRLLKERFEGGDEPETRPLSPVEQKVYQQARSLFPHDSVNAFNGGVSFKSATVLALSRGTKTYLFLYRDEKISRLGEFDSIGYSWIEVKHVSSSKVIFLLRTHETFDRGDNPLFIFDGTKLLRIKEYSELHDAAVDPAGRRIAYCYWAGDKRHIAVKELR